MPFVSIDASTTAAHCRTYVAVTPAATDLQTSAAQFQKNVYANRRHNNYEIEIEIYCSITTTCVLCVLKLI